MKNSRATRSEKNGWRFQLMNSSVSFSVLRHAAKKSLLVNNPL